MLTHFVWIVSTRSHSLDLFLVFRIFWGEVSSLDKQCHERYLKDIPLLFQSHVHQWQGILEKVKACRVQKQKKTQNPKTNQRGICITRESNCTNSDLRASSFKRETGSFHWKPEHFPLPQNTSVVFLWWLFSSSHNGAGHWVGVGPQSTLHRCSTPDALRSTQSFTPHHLSMSQTSWRRLCHERERENRKRKSFLTSVNPVGKNSSSWSVGLDYVIFTLHNHTPI